MQGDPLSTFGALWKACVSDDDTGKSLLTSTAVAFGLGILASSATAYLLSVAHATI